MKINQRMVVTALLGVAITAAAYRFPQTRQLLTGEGEGGLFGFLG